MSTKDGATEMILSRDMPNKQVILRFKEPMLWVAFTPENAVAIGEALAKEAYYVRFGNVVKEGSAPAMVDQIRDRLVNTVTLMIASMGREGRSPAIQARQIVDMILTRVT